MASRKTRFQADSAFAAQVLEATAKLSEKVSELDFADPVAYTYNPLDYAWDLHTQYVRKWGASKRRILMMGMNPGPWGMAQTGVPFGEIQAVRGWLGLNGKVNRPENEHPKRPVLGLDCPRSEVSGRRLWGYFAEEFKTPAAFFTEHIIVNYCPLVFMEEGGRNHTPDKLPANEAGPLFAACDQRLRALVELYQPQWVVGMGGFARKKLEKLFGKNPTSTGLKIGTILHPSPASPAANRGWAAAAARQFTEQGIWV